MGTVLVLDSLQRKSLAITRFLGMDGHRVLVADTTFFAISRFSRYAARGHVYPPTTQPQQFLAWLHTLLAKEPIDAVIPTDDDTTELLAAHQQAFAGHTGLLVPPQAAFAAMRDKGESPAWFARAGVPHPRTAAISDLSELRAAAAEIGLPLVIKARRSSGSRGVRFVHHMDALEEAYQAVHSEYPWPILQQFIAPGPKYQVGFLYGRDSKPAARYVQQDLRQYPIGGGPSTLGEIVDRPDLLQMVAPLFEQLAWVGPVHADVMEDGRTGQPYILEVNPRYSQSIHLAHRAGVNMARLHLALALGQQPPAADLPRAGVHGRSLVPFDLLAYLSDPNRSRWNPHFFASYGPDTWDDLLSWSDPGPSLGFLLAVGRYLFTPAMWRAVLRLDNR